MLDLIFPNHKNGYKAHLIKVPALIFFAIFLVLFNLTSKSSISAQDYTKIINAENLTLEHNKVRTQNNLFSLKLNPILSASAQNKAQKMLETNCWSHYCPPGKDPWDFFDESGYIYVYAGENLAEGFNSLEVLMNAWMNSKTHRDNILKSEFQEVGFGLVSGDYQNKNSNLIVVVHFGTQAQLISATQNSANNQNAISILSPKANESINSQYINVNGTAKGLDKVDVYNNAELKGSSNILDGVYIFRIDSPAQGKNIVAVKGNINGENSESIVEVSVNIPEPSKADIIISGQSILPISITSGVQNSINLIFVVILGLLFLIDFIVLSRTKVVDHKRSFSHYHFSLFLIVGILILVGGFAGNIGAGIFK